MFFKKFRKEIISILLILVFCCATVVVVDTIFLTEKGDQTPEIAQVDPAQFQEGYIEVLVHILTIDPASEDLAVELQFIPHGKFDLGDGLLAVPLEVDISSAAHDEILFDAGKRMFPVETHLDFYEGEVEEYPFDQHSAVLEILVIEEATADGSWASVPTKIEFFSAHHSYVFDDQPLPPSEHGYVGFDIHVKRSPLVIGTAIFWMLTIWGLTIINMALFVGVMLGRVKADFSLFGYMSGFIVAMYFFREMFPDIPPFLGVLADYMAIFWAILVAAGIANVVAIKWLLAVFKDDDKQPDSI